MTYYIQTKLTKIEWEGIEKPLPKKEMDILHLIKQGYHHFTRTNNNLSLLGYTKIKQTRQLDNFLYFEFFKCKVDELKKYNVDFTVEKIKSNPSKTDIIRIKNVNTFTDAYEFMLLGLIKKLCKKKKKEGKSSETVKLYYSLVKLVGRPQTIWRPLGMGGGATSVAVINTHILDLCQYIIELYDIPYDYLVRYAATVLENNEYLSTYADNKLYSHQSAIFSACKVVGPKLIFYSAPTGTGKTLTPIGLSESYKIIFLCAARHVGLALARAAISMDKKIALAFNCETPDEIKLHYAAATDFTRDWKSGGIRKVDNSIGDKVEIIICDIKSYISAMHYMVAFHPKENIISFWDEPTISLDMDEDPLHEIIHANWRDNKIPTMILSSATLPNRILLDSVCTHFSERFGGKIIEINSNDTLKSVGLLNKENKICMPHTIYDTYEAFKIGISHCKTKGCLLRYIDIKQIERCMHYCRNKWDIMPPEMDIMDFDMKYLKAAYLDILDGLNEEQWRELQILAVPLYPSTINIMTTDAYTLTSGPTIYLANNVEKVAKVLLQQAKLSATLIKELTGALAYNDTLSIKIDELIKLYEDGIGKDGEKEKKMTNLNIKPELKMLKRKIETMQKQYQKIQISDYYIPNRKDHNERWKGDNQDIFTSNVDESISEKILQIEDIEDSWKILLLLGIGVFTKHRSIVYMEIMKQLAQDQKLFLIIASSDFIYGTNYQFCHGYIGKDLSEMTQEKLIQSLGRIGRNGAQQTYTARLRDNSLIHKLFLPDTSNIEATKMCELFCDVLAKPLSKPLVKPEICCAICLNNLKVDEQQHRLSCSHLFHNNCINEWLRMNASCPTCRQKCN